MRSFRRLPPLLRVATILGALLAPMALVLAVLAIMGMSSHFPVEVATYRSDVIAFNLALLGLACYPVDKAYLARLGRLDRGLFPLNSWQSQALALALLGALPLCVLTAALVIPLNLPQFLFLFEFTIAEGWLFVAFYWMLSRTRQTAR